MSRTYHHGEKSRRARINRPYAYEWAYLMRWYDTEERPALKPAPPKARRYARVDWEQGRSCACRSCRLLSEYREKAFRRRCHETEGYMQRDLDLLFPSRKSYHW